MAIAEDAAQEATLRAWRQRRACRNGENPGPWLRRIAHNEAIRAATQRAELLVEDRLDRVATTDDCARVVAGHALRGMLAALPLAERRVLFLYHWRDVSVREIAAQLRVPEGTVKVQLHRGRARLRRMMEE